MGTSYFVRSPYKKKKGEKVAKKKKIARRYVEKLGQGASDK